MKKLSLIFILLAIVSSAIAQNRIAKGSVLDDRTREPIDSALVRVLDTTFYTYTDTTGYYAVQLPRKHRTLEISHKDYKSKSITMAPGHQHRHLKVYLRSGAIEKLKRDSSFLDKKNALSLSLVELFSVAIAIRYERFLTLKHSLGLHNSFYVYGVKPNLGTRFETAAHYNGFKSAPFYRFYPVHKAELGFFIEGKIPFGYFNFREIEYQYKSDPDRNTSISHAFWTWGFGIGTGIMLPISGTKYGFLNLSIGFQYFPIVDLPIQLYYKGNTKYPYTTDTDSWWHVGGPGGYFDLKITIGGIF